MRAFDLSPLLRSSIGFDDLARLTESLARVDPSAQSWPPYNIEKLGEDEYRITMAVAGFTPEELDIELEDRSLTITGRSSEDEEGRTFLHRGIAKRAFTRSFRLAETIEVNGARFENGLLSIDLVRRVPEHLKPRKIAIGTGTTVSGKKIAQKAA
ncbi:MAG: Hsp20 family protein [Rhodothalassiaceae bacterium]